MRPNQNGHKQMKSKKTRAVALILCLFLGVLGVHRLYAGKIGSGLVMFLITITGFGLFFTGIWALIDLVVIAAGQFKDGEQLLILTW